MLTIEPLPRATMRGTASDAQRKNPFRCVAITADQSANETWPTSPTRWMPALLTRMSIRPACRVDRLEGGRHARRVGDVGLEIDDAARGSVGRELVERENPRAVGEQALGDRVADPARRAGHDRDAPVKRIRHVAAPQYINQPPLTLIVAPVI